VRTLVIIPTYDEVDNIIPLVRGVLAQGPTIEVLVVDDGSPDGTGDRVEAFRAEHPHVHLIRRPRKLGLGTAYLAGFRFGLDRGFDALFTMDGDASHDPSSLNPMREALLTHDLVIGSRYVPGGDLINWSLFRRLLSRFANWYTKRLLALPQSDCTSGYRGYRRSVIESVDPFSIRASGYSFLEEMVWRVQRAGFSIVEVPIVFVDRARGTSKIETSEILKAAWHVLATALRRRSAKRPPVVPDACRRPSV